MQHDRDDFLPKTKDLLAKRVGYRCSNPSCRIERILCCYRVFTDKSVVRFRRCHAIISIQSTKSSLFSVALRVHAM